MGGRGAASPAGTSANSVNSPSWVQGLVRDTFARLAGPGGGFITIADLRDSLPGLSRDVFDQTIKELNRQPDVYIQPATNQKNVTQRERDEGIILGGQVNHIITIEKHP